ncbi:putative glycine dehydrogenase (decarboxylating) subunit 1 [Candidatus Xenohaliotis californiensis]|uniref:Glycine dehydrogenase (Decarboxylating) subunit 1 n=1 Tax=Candidatus Xenohaliotis californiensis TaxID=84677 RepID=A0ABM9N702_9RICK|nr:putative glycine dehydrogenase (decarboxylating) subunit 1 [Candidatus Xenohaliotis californiensis]
MRYTVLSKQEKTSMLSEMNIENVDTFYGNMYKLINNEQIKIPNHKSEIEVESILYNMAMKNLPASKAHCFLGAGCYNHHIPAAVESIIGRSEFLTSYTPYQPEISQGTLKAMFEFQTSISRIVGMDISNSSYYDGANSLASAITMSKSINKKNSAVIANTIHPDYIEVAKNYGHSICSMKNPEKQNISCIIVQYPDFHGSIPNLKNIRKIADEHSALMIVVVNEIIALGLLPPPIEADIVCGDASSIGIRNNFGGPHLGILACKKQYIRKISGRLCGETKDRIGNTAYTLTLSTREQHIKREKANSNICTNQALSAIAFTVHISLLGEHGFKKLANINHEKACILADELEKIPGISVKNTSFFNEFVAELPTTNVKLLIKKFIKKNIIAGYPIASDRILLAATELTTNQNIRVFCKALRNKFN